MRRRRILVHLKVMFCAVAGNCEETADTSSFESDVFSSQILCECYFLLFATSSSVEECLVKCLTK